MPKNNEEEVKERIVQLTKAIGKAKRNHDYNELENLRQQRNLFIKQLSDEFDAYFWIKDGKTQFGTLEEVEEFYGEDKNIIAVRASGMETELLKGRLLIINRQKELQAMDAVKVKETVLQDLDNQLEKISVLINTVRNEAELPPLDFSAVDKKNKKKEDFLDGIDMSSLE